MLDIRSISAGYADAGAATALVLRDLNLSIPAAQITCLMGRNGAGKSTLLKTIMGLVPLSAGQITLAGQRLDTLPAHRVPGQGIGYVPQGRRLFGEMTVAENLEIGLMARNTGAERASDTAQQIKERVLTLFPRLRERLTQLARSLSGGEQQMLAIARALCLSPTVLLLDEPSEGLQPSMIALIREVVLQLKSEGVAVVLVEQRVETALSLADQIAFMVQGSVAEVISAQGLHRAHPSFAKYVGV